jgi:hypothetical protein
MKQTPRCTEHGNQLLQTDHRPQTTHFTSFLLPDKPRGASPGLGWYYHWYVKISIGNKFWGPLNQKKGGTLCRLRIYHRQRNKFFASHITLVLIHSLRVGWRNGGILKNYWPNLLVVCIFPDISCLFWNIRIKFVGPLIFSAKVNPGWAG